MRFSPPSFNEANIHHFWACQCLTGRRTRRLPVCHFNWPEYAHTVTTRTSTVPLSKAASLSGCSVLELRASGT
eukprot:2067528-Rhodomonas_salina.2